MIFLSNDEYQYINIISDFVKIYSTGVKYILDIFIFYIVNAIIALAVCKRFSASW
jgi:hypothetical protein